MSTSYDFYLYKQETDISEPILSQGKVIRVSNALREIKLPYMIERLNTLHQEADLYLDILYKLSKDKEFPNKLDALTFYTMRYIGVHDQITLLLKQMQ